MDRVSLRSIRATLALMVMRSIYQGKCRSVTWVERRETFGAALAWPGAHNGKAFSRRARARVFVHERHDLPPGNKGGAPKATRSPDERQRNPGRAFKLPTRSRISRSLSSGRPLRAGPVGSSGLQIHPATRLQRREAERRQTRISNLRTPTFILAASGRTEEGARRASIGTRSPVGVPPRHLLRRTNANGSAPATRFLGRGPDRRYPSSACPSPASSSQTGHNAGRAYSRSRPRTELRAPPAGTAPAPSIGRHR